MSAVSTSPRGTTFARVCLAVAKAGGSITSAAADAAEDFGPHNDVAKILKSAVAVGTLGGSGAALEWRGASAEFLALVRDTSLVGRLQGLRRVPLGVRIVHQTGGTTGHFVAENEAIPVSAGAFTEVMLRPAKVSAITVVTDELYRAGPLAETILRDDLVQALARALDAAFTSTSPASGGTPAGVLNGATTFAATADPRDDLATMIAAFSGDLERAVWLMSPTVATRLSGSDYPTIGARGGTLLGMPVYTSSAMAAGTIALIDPASIAYGESGTVEIDASREALLQMSTTPDNPSTAATTMTSLFQTNAVGLRASMYTNWAADSSAVLLTGVAY